jgi:hypothetical protein
MKMKFFSDIMTTFPRRLPRAPLKINFRIRNTFLGVGLASPFVFGKKKNTVV